MDTKMLRVCLLLAVSCVLLFGNRFVGRILISAEFTRGFLIGVGLVMGSVALATLVTLTLKARQGTEGWRNGK